MVSAIYQWFTNHIYHIIQDLTGSTRARQVKYLKDNSMLLNTSICNKKMGSLNQLVEMYLQQDKGQAVPLPDLILPNGLNEGLQSWSIYPIEPRMAPVNEEETDITQVLSSYDIIEKDGEPLEIFQQDKQYPYKNVILPVCQGASFKVIKSCVVVHWRLYDL